MIKYARLFPIERKCISVLSDQKCIVFAMCVESQDLNINRLHFSVRQAGRRDLEHLLFLQLAVYCHYQANYLSNHILCSEIRETAVAWSLFPYQYTHWRWKHKRLKYAGVLRWVHLCFDPLAPLWPLSSSIGYFHPYYEHLSEPSACLSRKRRVTVFDPQIFHIKCKQLPL